MKAQTKKIVIISAALVVVVVLIILIARQARKRKAAILSDSENGGQPSTGAAPAAKDMDSLPTGAYPVKFGDKNRLVWWLQYALNLKGAKLQQDGDFGKNTAAALKKYYGLTSVSFAQSAMIYNDLTKGASEEEKQPIKETALRASLDNRFASTI